MAYIILIVRHLYLKKWYKMIHFSLVLVKWKQTHENDTDFHTTPLLLKNTKNGKLQVFTKDKGINEWWVKYERRNNRKMVFTIRKGSTIRKSHMWTSIYRVRFLWGPPLWCEPPSNVDDQVFLVFFVIGIISFIMCFAWITFFNMRSYASYFSKFRVIS